MQEVKNIPTKISQRRAVYARQVTIFLTLIPLFLAGYNYAKGFHLSTIANLTSVILYPIFYWISQKRQLLGFLLIAITLQILIFLQSNFFAPGRQLEIIFGLFTAVAPIFFDKGWLVYFLVSNTILFYLPWIRGVQTGFFVFQYLFFITIFFVVRSFLLEQDKLDHSTNELATVVQSQKQTVKNRRFKVATKPAASKNDLVWMEKVEKIVEQELTNKQFSLGMLAQQLFVGERQIQRRIKKITGLTPSQYFRELKLQLAKDLLEKHQYASVAEVAYAVGFDTPSYFSKIFEQRFGQRPISFFK